METTDNMNVKIQNSGAAGTSNTKGSSRELANYLEHEDKEREEQGKTIYPFTTPDGIPVAKEEVIEKIDRNKSHLRKNDDKFLHLIISPSREEIEAMGKNEKEVYEKGILYARMVSDAYAQNFHREGIESSENLLIYWKPHFTRGENDEEQFHLHAIVSRKSKDGEKSLHALTPHRNTEKGAVKGGFDRTAFYVRCEKLFDQLINYDRKVAETFEYHNAMAHGTAEEKAQQAERLARENEIILRNELEAAFSKRRKRKKGKAEVEELLKLLQLKDFTFISSAKSMEDVIEVASIGSELMKAIAISQDELAFRLNLASLGYSIRPKFLENGGVNDLLISYKGQRFLASEIFDNQKFRTLLSHWQRLSGQEPAFRIRERQEQQETERKIKLTLEQSQQSRSRGLRMKH